MSSFDLLLREPNPLEIPAGRAIFSQGDPGDHLYAVVQGEVEIVRDGHVLATIQEGGVFGEMALIDQLPRSASARAKTDCRLTTVNARRFMLLVQNAPFFALQMMRLLAERLRDHTES